MKKKLIIIIALFAICIQLIGCSEQKSSEQTEMTVLAAASLTDVCEELEEEYKKENQNTVLKFSFGGSGTLKTQIEEGVPADIFISAAEKQMYELKSQGLMIDESIADIAENKVVLVVPEGNPAGIRTFEDAATAEIIGIGEPESVPAGQYAREIFSNLGIWNIVKQKANFGSDVRTVLSWVESGAVDCGVVYATDANMSRNTEIVCEAKEGTHEPVIYPAGVIKASKNIGEAQEFTKFLKSERAAEIFEKYGFTVL
ncbi:MAG: molybdate ABC transporter substrate-binding protein [Anaerovoracaceae bacterium]|nr:molybdate ABC transporter substrate-binding protein [Anaerovoracaceae bacterium]